MPAEPPANRLRDAWIRVNREDNVQFRSKRRQTQQRTAHDVGIAIVVFAPMQRDEYAVATNIVVRLMRLDPIDRPPKAVDSRVAGLIDRVGGYAFGAQVGDGCASGREMNIGQASDAPAKPFLGKRLGCRRRSQSRFDMRDEAIAIPTRGGPGVGSKCVALHEHAARSMARDDGSKLGSQMLKRCE